jgi:hypothetical protein
MAWAQIISRSKTRVSMSIPHWKLYRGTKTSGNSINWFTTVWTLGTKRNESNERFATGTDVRTSMLSSAASAPIKKGLHNFANFLFFIARGRWQIGLLALRADCQGAELTVRPLDGMQTLATKGGQCARRWRRRPIVMQGGPLIAFCIFKRAEKSCWRLIYSTIISF